MHDDVLILGGGLAGLSGALRLATSGRRVRILEERGFCGGRTYSFVDPATGATLDNGQHVFLACCHAFRQYLREIGSEQHTVLQDRMRMKFIDSTGQSGTLQEGFGPAPYHLAGSMMKMPFLPFRDRVGAAGVVLKLKNMTDAQLQQMDTTTFGDWLRGEGIPEHAIRAFWNVFVLATLNGDIDNVSAALGAWVYREGILKERGTGRIGVMRKGLSDVLVDPAVRRIEAAGSTVQTHARIVALTRTAHSWKATLANGESHEAPSVVLALPHQRAAGLLGEPLAQVAALPVAPIVSLYLWLDQKLIHDSNPDGFVASVDTRVQWVFDREHYLPRKTKDGGHLHCILYSGADRECALSADALTREAVGELRRLFPRSTFAVQRARVIKARKSTYLPIPGQAAIRPEQRIDDGLVIAGAWVKSDWPSTMEAAVQSGNRAAELLST
jgi:squalene-associated FAD-dependent desaturase